MRIALIASVLVLSGCNMVGDMFGASKPAEPAPEPAPVAASGEKLAITKATWAAFENYKFWLTPIAWTRPMGQGYFAVAKDGRSWGLTGCPVNECIAGSPVSQDAVEVCQTRSGGVPCVVFAKDQDIIIPYDIID